MKFLLRFADRRAHLLDELEDRLRRSVRKHERLDDVVLARLGRATLDHHDGVFRDGDHEIDVGGRLLLERRVSDEFSFEPAHADDDDGAAPRDVGDVQGGARAGQGEHVGRVDLVGGEHRRDDLRVTPVTVGKKRT